MWEGVSRNEACKGFPVVHFLEALVPDSCVHKVSIFIIIYCNFCPENKKVFSYNYNIIFLMCNIRSYLGLWSLNTHLLLD